MRRLPCQPQPVEGTGGLADAGASSTLAAQRWYASSLADPAEAGVSGWTSAEVVQLLKTAINRRASVMGPMAEVVAGSTQYLSEPDLRAMARYLIALPAPATTAPAWRGRRPAGILAQGEKRYSRHCADCHGAQRQGAPGIYPALAGNRAVTLANPRNLVLTITGGGFASATDAKPRRYGMPAFDLSHADLAALSTWLRAAWGHEAAPLSEVDMLPAR